MENFHHITLYLAILSTYFDINPLKVENNFHVSLAFNLSIKFNTIMIIMESKKNFIQNQDVNDGQIERDNFPDVPKGVRLSRPERPMVRKNQPAHKVIRDACGEQEP